MELQNLIDQPNELLELINSCLKPKQSEKQNNGEVFTPMPLIYEMLDIMDANYMQKNKHKHSIFSEKHFKWGDIVGSGMGNFSIAIYYRLLDGLKDELPDILTRKKHILENMLYMAEKNKKNVHITRQIFDINNTYKLNIYEGDALELNPKTEWNIDKFDVIVGNPPYNSGGIKSSHGKLLGEKNETIWPKFVEKSFSLLKENGYMAFIHPLSWLRKSHSSHDIIMEKHVIWLKLWDNMQSLAMINGEIPISIYVLHNNINIHKLKTQVISENKRKKIKTISNEYLDKNYSLPLAYHPIFNKLRNFIEQNALQLEINAKTIKSIGTKMKLPKNYTIDDMWAIDTYTLKEGIMVKKATVIHPDATKHKLIIANKASFKGAFIDEGKLSLTGNNKYYIVGNNLNVIIKILNFQIANIIGHYTKYGQDFLDKDAFTYIPDIRKLGINDITEQEFYKMIGLTEEDMNSINNPSMNYNEE